MEKIVHSLHVLLKQDHPKLQLISIGSKPTKLDPYGLWHPRQQQVNKFSDPFCRGEVGSIIAPHDFSKKHLALGRMIGHNHALA